MERPTVVLELDGDSQVARDLSVGGVFVPSCELELDTDCDLLLRGASGELRVAARVVWHSPGKGAGLQLIDCDAALREQIAALAAKPEPEPEPEPEPDTVSETESVTESEPDTDTEPDTHTDTEAPKPASHGPGIPRNVHERLRGLSIADQLKLAHTGEVTERIVLERMYGKTVWEALLRNPRLTGPEVARIARMGALPRPLIELIVGNGAWLQIGEVRRALLSNPRLGTDQIVRVLRLLPKHELKLAAVQTAYPHAVRDAARRMVREMGG